MLEAFHLCMSIGNIYFMWLLFKFDDINLYNTLAVVISIVNFFFIPNRMINKFIFKPKETSSI